MRLKLCLLFLLLIVFDIKIYAMEMQKENKKMVIFIKEQLQEERISRENYNFDAGSVPQVNDYSKKIKRKENVKTKRRLYKQSKGDREMIRKQMAAEIFLREQENGSHDNEILQFLQGDKK